MPLEEGERVVWEARQSGVTGPSQLWIHGATLAGLGTCGLFSLPMLFVIDLDAIDLAVAVVQQLACAAPGLLMAFAWAMPRFRVSLALTDQRLLSQSAFGAWTSVWLKQLKSAERYVAVYHGRHGPREVVTDRLKLEVAPQTVLWGPTTDADFVIELLEHGVLSGKKWIDLAMLPDLRGKPAPAETRTDVFVCATSRTEGDLYGPLFVTEQKIVRITETLSGERLGRLFTLLGDPAQDPLAAMEQILSHPSTGHFVALDRAKVKPILDQKRLEIRGEGVGDRRSRAKRCGSLAHVPSAPLIAAAARRARRWTRQSALDLRRRDR
jgi:hypothetical protein